MTDLFQTIIIKYSDEQGKIPDFSSLEYGELALNIVDGFLYTRTPDDRIIQITSSDFPAGSVGTDEIADGAITTQKLADLAVTLEKLADGSVSFQKLTPELQAALSGANGIYLGAFDTAPTSRVNGAPLVSGDFYIDTTEGEYGARFRWDGTQFLRDRLINNGDIGTPELADGSVTVPKLAQDVLDLIAQAAGSSVGTARLEDGSVTLVKLGQDVLDALQNAINQIPDGSITVPKLAQDTLDLIAAPVNTDRIVDLAVTTEKLADESVTREKLDPSLLGALSGAPNGMYLGVWAGTPSTRPDGSDILVGDYFIQSGYTVTNQSRQRTLMQMFGTAAGTPTQFYKVGFLNVGDVQEFHIDTDAVTEAKIKDKAVSTSKLDDLAVTTAKVNTKAITEPKLADLSVSNRTLIDGAVSTDKVEDGAITTPKIAGRSVTEDKLGDDVLVRLTEAETSIIDTGRIANGAVTAEKLAPGVITPDLLSPEVVDGATEVYFYDSASLFPDAPPANKLFIDKTANVIYRSMYSQPVLFDFVVGADGDFATLQEAIDSPSVGPGSTIQLKSQQFLITEPIKITKSVRVFGEDRDLTQIITDSVDGALPAIDIKASNVILYGFTVKQNQAQSSGITDKSCAIRVMNRSDYSIDTSIDVFLHNLSIIGRETGVLAVAVRNLQIIGCSFDRNNATEYQQSHITLAGVSGKTFIENNTFQGRVAVYGTYSDGTTYLNSPGNIYCIRFTTPTLLSQVFNSNVVGDEWYTLSGIDTTKVALSGDITVSHNGMVDGTVCRTFVYFENEASQWHKHPTYWDAEGLKLNVNYNNSFEYLYFINLGAARYANNIFTGISTNNNTYYNNPDIQAATVFVTTYSSLVKSLFDLCEFKFFENTPVNPLATVNTTNNYIVIPGCLELRQTVNGGMTYFGYDLTTFDLAPFKETFDIPGQEQGTSYELLYDAGAAIVIDVIDGGTF